MDVHELRLKESIAHAKMVAAGGQRDDWGEDEFYEWMETLPDDEAVAVFMGLLRLQDDEEEPEA